MPFTVKQLIGDNQNPVTVYDTDPVTKAQELMVKNKFSQLPVIDKQGKVLGLITSDSILRALNIFGTSAASLRVADAMEKVKKPYREDDDLSSLLDELLMETYAALIVDGERKLIGIVTSYDTTQYFRQRAEDLMYAEDIETRLKDYINAYFTKENGEIDEDARNAAIAEITPSNNDLLKPFRRALTDYLKLRGESQPQIDANLAEQAFTTHLYRKDATKPFDKLVQSQYIDLFLHPTRWAQYEPIFSLGRKKILELFDNVRATRNDIAHFRSKDITQEQREKLKFCSDWLERHEEAVYKAFGINTETTEAKYPAAPQSPIIDSTSEPPTEEIIPVEESASPNDGRYALLAIRLQQLLSYKKVFFTFKQIEEIIGGELPASAYQHSSWWINQFQQWLDIGWRISYPSVVKEVVGFIRTKEQEKAYIDFYSALLSELTKVAQFHVRQTSPDGSSWLIIAQVPSKGSQLGSLGYSFSLARHGHFRVQFYIDCGDKEKNKALYDKLYIHKDTMQTKLEDMPSPLEWERMDDKRASRIALYHIGAITDNAGDLAKLREWAVLVMIGFQKVLEQQVNELQ